MGKEVIILAGGLGTRLRDVVRDVPKCMAPVAGKPFLWYLLKYLSRFDVVRVVLSVGYLRDVVINWVGSHRAEFPFDFDYAIETSPLGTGGGIKLALGKCASQDVVVMNGDTLFNVDIDALYGRHRLFPASITLALKPMRNFSRYGNVVVNNGLVVRFEEKQYCEAGLINGGVYVINKSESLFAGLPDKFSFETDVLQPQSEHGSVYGVADEGYFIDIGIPEDYARANVDFPKLQLFI